MGVGVQDIAARLDAAGRQRQAAADALDTETRNVARLARVAHDSAMPIADIARLARVSRPTIYAFIRQDRKK